MKSTVYKKGNVFATVLLPGNNIVYFQGKVPLWSCHQISSYQVCYLPSSKSQENCKYCKLEHPLPPVNTVVEFNELENRSLTLLRRHRYQDLSFDTKGACQSAVRGGGEFDELMESANRSTEFSFNNEVYQQREGGAMGSPQVTALTNIFVCVYASQFFGSTSKPQVFLDILMSDLAILKEEYDCNVFLQKLNALHPSLYHR